MSILINALEKRDEYAALCYISECTDELDLRCTNEENETVLHVASKHNLVCAVKLLLKHRANINALDSMLNTPLMLSLKWASIECADVLLGRGPDISITDCNRDLCLHIAAKHGFDCILNTIISKKANVNAQNKYKETPIVYAVENNHETTARILVQNGADILIKNRGGTPVLAMAIEKEMVLLVRTILQCKEGSEAFKTTVETIKQTKGTILENITDFQIADEAEKLRCLNAFSLYAVEYGHLDRVSSYLEKGADLNHKSVEGDSLVHVSIVKRRLETTKLLVQHGAVTDTTNAEGLSPIGIALGVDDSSEYALSVISGGLSLETLNSKLKLKENESEKYTPLDMAIRRGWWNVVCALLECGATDHSQESFSPHKFHKYLKPSDGFTEGLRKEDRTINKERIKRYRQYSALNVLKELDHPRECQLREITWRLLYALGEFSLDTLKKDMQDAWIEFDQWHLEEIDKSEHLIALRQKMARELEEFRDDMTEKRKVAQKWKEKMGDKYKEVEEFSDVVWFKNKEDEIEKFYKICDLCRFCQIKCRMWNFAEHTIDCPIRLMFQDEVDSVKSFVDEYLSKKNDIIKSLKTAPKSDVETSARTVQDGDAFSKSKVTDTTNATKTEQNVLEVHESYSGSEVQTKEGSANLVRQYSSRKEQKGTEIMVLHECVLRDDIQKLDLNLKRCKHTVNAMGGIGWTPLHLAIAFQKHEAVKVLLKHGADINIRTKCILPTFIIENIFDVASLYKSDDKAIVFFYIKMFSYFGMINGLTALQLATYKKRSTAIIEDIIRYRDVTENDVKSCLELSFGEAVERTILHCLCTKAELCHKRLDLKVTVGYEMKPKLQRVLFGLSTRVYKRLKKSFLSLKLKIENPIMISKQTPIKTKALSKDQTFSCKLGISQVDDLLWSYHSNLNAISAALVGGKPTLILSCEQKGFIPITDIPFQTHVSVKEDLLRMKVRNGSFTFGTRREVKMGNSVSSVKATEGYGTVGPYIRLPDDDNSTAFLTCAHVLHTAEELLQQQFGNDVEVHFPSNEQFDKESQEILSTSADIDRSQIKGSVIRTVFTYHTYPAAISNEQNIDEEMIEKDTAQNGEIQNEAAASNEQNMEQNVELQDLSMDTAESDSSTRQGACNVQQRQGPSASNVHDVREKVDVDAALVRIENYVKLKGEIAPVYKTQMKAAELKEDMVLEFNTGDILDATGDAVGLKVYKFGHTTGLTHGLLVFDNGQVKLTEEGSSDHAMRFPDDPSTKVIMKGQLMVERAANQDFFVQGDSGSAVFAYTGGCEHEAPSTPKCVGMAIGRLDNQYTVVTPIREILKALGKDYVQKGEHVDLKLKKFTVDENLSVLCKMCLNIDD